MSGSFLPDGRDFDSVFTRGNGGQWTNFIADDGQDMGQRFIAGNSGITTGFKIADGRDLGQVLGTNYMKWSKVIDSLCFPGDYAYFGDGSPYTFRCYLFDGDWYETPVLRSADTGVLYFKHPNTGQLCRIGRYRGSTTTSWADVDKDRVMHGGFDTNVTLEFWATDLY